MYIRGVSCRGESMILLMEEVDLRVSYYHYLLLLFISRSDMYRT